MAIAGLDGQWSASDRTQGGVYAKWLVSRGIRNLQSAFDDLSSSGNSSNTASVDQVFSSLDGNGDGKVSFKDAMAYDQANQTGASGGGSSTTASSASATSDTTKLDAQIMKQIMELMRAYGSDSGSSISSLMKSVSTTA